MVKIKCAEVIVVGQDKPKTSVGASLVLLL
jgi:hypothetical protein